MKVTQVSLRPTEAADAAGRPTLTPELLAASGARYSRNNEGLDAILAKIDPKNLDKSVDSIFRMLDYGHQSIADMVPVALFLDGVSLWLAYYVWTLCPVAGGQESSTRYIRLGEEGLVAPEILGIPEAQRSDWSGRMRESFAAYESAVAFWESLVAERPGLARIPSALLADTSDKAKKAVARMRRNYAFDRARYFLPVAAKTNLMLLQSARAWVTLVQHLLSHPLPEANALGALVRDELSLAAPRMLRHATEKPYFVAGLRDELSAWQAQAGATPSLNGERAATATLEVFGVPGADSASLATDLRHHQNRYAYFGETLRRTAVRFGWEAVAFAEIRDLNRHRTGTKYCPLVPVGFYHAVDELPEDNDAYRATGVVGVQATQAASDLLQQGEPTYVYHTLLGTQFPFEHTTTADKFLYEAELRTGTGAHYRYARHLHDALALWFERFPETKGLIIEGMAEPE